MQQVKSDVLLQSIKYCMNFKVLSEVMEARSTLQRQKEGHRTKKGEDNWGHQRANGRG